MTISSSKLIAANRFMNGYGLSFINTIVNCAIKGCQAIYRKIYGEKTLQDSRKESSLKHYWEYIDQMDKTTCGLGLVPGLGSVFLSIKHGREERAANRRMEPFKNQPRMLIALGLKNDPLWKNADYALLMVKDKIENLEFVPMELLYDPNFMRRVIKECPGVVDGQYYSTLDPGYQATCKALAARDPVPEEGITVHDLHNEQGEPIVIDP